MAAMLLELLQRSFPSRRFVRPVLALACGAALLDVAPRRLPSLLPLEYERLHEAMRSTQPPKSDRGADLVLPICDELNYAAPLASAPGFRPLVNGKSGYLLPQNGRIFETLGVAGFGRAQSDLLKELGVTRLVIDRTRIRVPEEAAILDALSASGAVRRSAGVWRNHQVVLLSWDRPATAREPK